MSSATSSISDISLRFFCLTLSCVTFSSCGGLRPAAPAAGAHALGVALPGDFFVFFIIFTCFSLCVRLPPSFPEFFLLVLSVHYSAARGLEGTKKIFFRAESAPSDSCVVSFDFRLRYANRRARKIFFKNGPFKRDFKNHVENLIDSRGTRHRRACSF